MASTALTAKDFPQNEQYKMTTHSQPQKKTGSAFDTTMPTVTVRAGGHKMSHAPLEEAAFGGTHKATTRLTSDSTMPSTSYTLWARRAASAGRSN